jgi:serine protease inhibitor
VKSLKTLGVPLFEGELLTNLIEGNLLLITGVMQKAVIKVDEKGTTAAAVTVLVSCNKHLTTNLFRKYASI